MCVAGAKIIHPKAVSLAKERDVKLKIKKAHDPISVGSLVDDNKKSYKKAIALNHSPCVYEFRLSMPMSDDKEEIIKEIRKHLKLWNFSDLKLIDVYYREDGYHFFLRGTDSNLDFFVKALEDDPIFEFIRSDLAEFSLTYSHKDLVQVIQNPMIHYQCARVNNLYMIVAKNKEKFFAESIYNLEVEK
jgi:hypothetical protein